MPPLRLDVFLFQTSLAIFRRTRADPPMLRGTARTTLVNPPFDSIRTDYAHASSVRRHCYRALDTAKRRVAIALFSKLCTVSFHIQISFFFFFLFFRFLLLFHEGIRTGISNRYSVVRTTMYDNGRYRDGRGVDRKYFQLPGTCARIRRNRKRNSRLPARWSVNSCPVASLRRYPFFFFFSALSPVEFADMHFSNSILPGKIERTALTNNAIKMRIFLRSFFANGTNRRENLFSHLVKREMNRDVHCHCCCKAEKYIGECSFFSPCCSFSSFSFFLFFLSFFSYSVLFQLTGFSR